MQTISQLSTSQIENRIAEINQLLKDQSMWHGHKTGFKRERTMLQKELQTRTFNTTDNAGRLIASSNIM